MAKYDKFVREGSIPFTEQEKELFIKHFSKLIVEHKDNDKVGFKHTNKIIDSKGSFNVHFSIDEPITKRDGKKNRIIDFKGIDFMVFKEKGYLDKTDWVNYNRETEIIKDYENAPEFQYAAYIFCYGYIIPFKCRTKWTVTLKESFQYDTEIESLTFNEAIEQLFNYLK